VTPTLGFRTAMTKTIFILALALSTTAQSQQPAPVNGSAAPSRWTPYARGGFVHQFDTNLNGGGKFDIDRLYIQGASLTRSVRGAGSPSLSAPDAINMTFPTTRVLRSGRGIASINSASARRSPGPSTNNGRSLPYPP